MSSDTTSDTTTAPDPDVMAELAEHTMYELVGGEPVVRAMIDRFYDLMDTEPAFAPIRRMHATDLSPMRQSLYEFVTGWLGGPQLFVQRTGSVCINAAHAPFQIDRAASDQWMQCMSRAMADAGIAERYRTLIEPAFARIGDMLRNTD